MVSSVDQWFGDCVVCQLVGNWYTGWYLDVFPWYTSWMGRKSPVKVPQNTAVIIHLLFRPVSSTRCDPLCSMVHEGTMLRPIWSQFMISSGGISSIVTVVDSCRINSARSLSKSSTRFLLLLVVALLLTNSILCSNVLAQSLVKTTWPPNSASKVLLVLRMIPLAAARVMAVYCPTRLTDGPQVLLYLSVELLPHEQRMASFLTGKDHDC